MQYSETVPLIRPQHRPLLLKPCLPVFAPSELLEVRAPQRVVHIRRIRPRLAVPDEVIPLHRQPPDQPIIPQPPELVQL